MKAQLFLDLGLYCISFRVYLGFDFFGRLERRTLGSHFGIQGSTVSGLNCGVWAWVLSFRIRVCL